MHLKLRENTQLVKPGLELETRHENGDVTRTPVSLNSHFHGKVTSDPGSLVAVSNMKGLVRNRLLLNSIDKFLYIKICTWLQGFWK